MKFIKLQDEVFNLTSTVEIKGIELYQKCGVRMQVNKTSDSDSSLWLLRQSAGPNKLKKLYFNIELADKENTLTQVYIYNKFNFNLISNT